MIVITSLALKGLFCHVLNTAQLSSNLDELHDLALYESGDALLGPDQKEALQNTRQLSKLLSHLSDADREQLRSLL